MVEGGSFPCSSSRCLLHQEALQVTRSIRSRRDGQEWRLRRRTTCTTRNVIYHIFCPCAQSGDYVGSTMDIKTRWSKHKTDIRKKNEFCGLTKHFNHYHQGDWQVAMARLEVTLLDHVDGTYSDERHLQLEKDWILNLGTWGPTGFNSRNELLTNQRRNWGLQ